MTTYRKLASSSIAAIERALLLRLERLSGVAGDSAEPPADELSLDDLSEGGDDQDNLATSALATSAQEFFAFERELIERLLARAAVIRRSDEKLRMFLDHVIEPLIAPRKKLLIFTEYRATQAYLNDALVQHFPDSGGITMINGSMSLDEKLAAIETFNDQAQFLISTEAGGEGINLHHSCHIMVNYDLPWNPARLAQRIGRLYRYGQKETVVVFNLHARDTFDNYAIDLMLQRVMQIVRDMAPVGSEYNDRLYAEILGEVLENVDLASVLRSATAMEIERTREQIEEALARARRARELEARYSGPRCGLRGRCAARDPGIYHATRSPLHPQYAPVHRRVSCCGSPRQQDIGDLPSRGSPRQISRVCAKNGGQYYNRSSTIPTV